MSNDPNPLALLYRAAFLEFGDDVVIRVAPTKRFERPMTPTGQPTPGGGGTKYGVVVQVCRGVNVELVRGESDRGEIGEALNVVRGKMRVLVETKIANLEKKNASELASARASLVALGQS